MQTGANTAIGPFTAVTRVQIPSGTPSLFRILAGLHALGGIPVSRQIASLQGKIVLLCKTKVSTT